VSAIPITDAAGAGEATPQKRSAGLPARARRRFDPEHRRSTLLTIVLWVIVLYFLFPLVWLLVASTKNNTDLFSSFGLWFGKDFSLQDGIFLRWGLNTVFYAVVSGVGAALLSTMAGYAFAKYRFPGGLLMFSVVLGAIMVPLTALAIPTYLMFSNFGITNTAWAIILPSLVSPFGVFLMRVYAADAIPDGLIEAARIDGAGEFRIFWQVGLRLLGPGIVTVFLFALVATWNNYLLPLIMLNSPSLFPLTVGLAQQQSASAAGGGAQALFSTVITGSLVSIIPLVIAFLYLQRYWQSGLATGGVKG
jgi:multiple sugar transport system permease protein